MNTSNVRNQHHRYIFDSEDKRHTLQRQNRQHTRTVMSAKHVVDTSAPQFWVPTVGSPLRLHKVVADARFRQQTDNSLNGSSKMVSEYDTTANTSVFNRLYEQRKENPQRPSTASRSRKVKSSKDTAKPRSMPRPSSAISKKKGSPQARSPSKRAARRERRQDKALRAAALDEAMKHEVVDSSRVILSDNWGHMSSTPPAADVSVDTPYASRALPREYGRSFNAHQNITVRLEDELSTIEKEANDERGDAVFATAASMLVPPEHAHVVDDFVQLCVDSPTMGSSGSDEARTRLLRHALREVEEKRLLSMYQ